MKFTPFALSLLFIFSSCSKNQGDEKNQLSDQFVSGELAEVAKARGLNSDDLIASVKTYNPSGASEEYLAFFGTGVSGRMAIVAMPSMKILKYVAVFSAEPWQGFAFDDESKSIVKGSSRDEIEYAFGDSGTPALSLTKGQQDGKSLFMSDGANGRLGLVDLAEYETKQIVTNPLFKNTNADVAVSSNSEYVVQTTALPESSSVTKKSQSGATFWRFLEKTHEEHKIYFIDPSTSFTVLLPGALQSSPAMGRGVSDSLMTFVSQNGTPELNVINWKVAQKVLATKAVKMNNHLTFSEEVATRENILKKYPLPAGSDRVIISGDGKTAIVTNKSGPTAQLIDLEALNANKFSLSEINVGGASSDAAFTAQNIYVTVHQPNQVVRISRDDKKITATHPLNFTAGKIMIPASDTTGAVEKYAIVSNLAPVGRFTSVGPQTGLSAHLVDIAQEKMQSLYDASIPQSTRLGAAAMPMKMNKPIYKYKIGTDPRSGLISTYKTNSGKEKIVRHGKRVHVYATLIRSHITPDFIEVEQGDLVSIHLTSNEQSKDQTHGFTIDTYNVHGSWEPGKSATVTFVADRSGVFPFFCTEFCSALHLEMQGYLLVKPSSDKKLAETDKLLRLHNNSEMKSFFNYIKGE